MRRQRQQHFTSRKEYLIAESSGRVPRWGRGAFGPKSMIKKTVNIFALLFALVSGHAAADTLCSRDVMCIESVANGDNVDVYIDNRQSAEITVSLDPSLSNMRADVALPYTETYPGLARTKAFTLSPIDLAQARTYRHTYEWTWGSLHAKHDDSYVYTLPFEPGKFYRVDQGYHGAFSHFGDFEYSIDWNMPMGSTIVAARDGIVVGLKNEYQVGGPDRALENYCNYIMIKHADGTIGEYDHLLAYSTKVKVGDRVQAGEVIARSGNSGFTTGPHLHFFVYKAIDGGHRQSFPVRFKLDEAPKGGTVEEGKTYMAF